MHGQYTQTYISSTTVATIATGNTTLHTVVCPIALVGTATFADSASATYFVLPIGSIGSLRFDSSCGNGLKVTTTSASDKLIVTTQTP